MDIKKLLKLDASGLEKLSDAQLREYFAPYLKAIHPEAREDEGKKEGPARKPKGKSELDKTLDMAAKMAARLGIKLDE